jgi:hypothetical protein
MAGKEVKRVVLRAVIVGMPTLFRSLVSAVICITSGGRAPELASYLRRRAASSALTIFLTQLFDYRTNG